MEIADHIINAKWIITCEEKNQVLEDHALVLKDSKILAVLPQKEVKNRYKASSTENYSTHAVMPGLINMHTHIPMSYFRGLADDLPLMDWLNNHIWPAEAKWLSPEFVYDASLFAMAEMIRGGTTCFNDMFFFMPDTARATERAGLRGHISIHVISFPTKWAKDADEEFEKGLAFHEEFKNSPNVTTTVALQSMYTVTKDKDLLRAREIAEDLDCQINMHVQETLDEIDILAKNYQMRPLERLHHLGFLSPRLIAIHMSHLNEDDMILLEKTKPNMVHCPESNMKLASGISPVTDCLARGINVSIGTDSTASNNDLNMIGEMRTAAFLAKCVTKNPTSLPAEQTLKMATLNAAKALKIDHYTGSLAVGKAADFIAINLDELETLPIYHPISQIIYATSRQQVTDVWVAGKQLLRNRELLTLDEKELKAKAKEWGNKIKQK